MPGDLLTDISNAWPAEMRAMMERQIPMGASDASSYTSGAVIKIDSGWAYRAS